MNDQSDAQFFSMCLFLFLTLYIFRAHRARHQERKIVSIQRLVTVTMCRWPFRVQVGSSLPTCTRHRVRATRGCIDTIFVFNSLHVSSTSCSSSGEKNCVNTISGSCHSVSVAVSCAGQKWTSDLHTTQSDSYQRLYWPNFSLLMMSTMCSKHVES